MSMIRDLPWIEKPREKAVQYGVASLSTRELLAVLIRTGSKGRSALDVADALLRKGNGLNGLEKMSIQELCRIEGISTVKALEIQTCFELNRRLKRESAMKCDVIHNPAVLVDWLQSEMGGLLQERMLAVYLSNDNRIIRWEDLFRGTIDMTGIYAREVLRNAILYGSTHVIVVHNHPSGNVSPSSADIDATKTLVTAGKLMGVKVLDHIIVSNNAYFSFEEHGLMVK